MSFGVVSPGPLVPGDNLANILTYRFEPRNPALTSAVRSSGSPRSSAGVDRIYREMIRTDGGPPRLTADFDRVGEEPTNGHGPGHARRPVRRDAPCE